MNKSIMCCMFEWVIVVKNETVLALLLNFPPKELHDVSTSVKIMSSSGFELDLFVAFVPYFI